MNRYDNFTASPKYCSNCGNILTGAYFFYGYGKQLCGICQNHRMGMESTTSPVRIPQLDHTSDWLKENVRLNEENTELKKQVANLEEKLQMIADWFHCRPKSASLTLAFTSVPREWWLEGEPLLSLLCDIDSSDDED